jgi:hypothetical protein
VWEANGSQKVSLVHRVEAQLVAGCVQDLMATSHPARKQMSSMDVGTGPAQQQQVSSLWTGAGIVFIQIITVMLLEGMPVCATYEGI